MTRVTLTINGFQLVCEVALTPAEKSNGLQGHAPLAESAGMLFVFESPQQAVFHMGSVAFPIDIVYCYRGRVQKVVSNAQPGSKEHWRAWCDQVLELRGGWCADHAVQIGSEVIMNRTAGQTYDLLRTLTTASSTPTAADVHATFRELARKGLLPDLRKIAEHLFAEYIEDNPEVIDRDELSQIECDRIVQDWTAKSRWVRELEKLAEKGKLPGYDEAPDVYEREFAFAIAAELPAVLAEAHTYFQSRRGSLFALAPYIKALTVEAARDVAAIACVAKKRALANKYPRAAQQLVLLMAPLGPSYLEPNSGVESKFYDLLDLFDSRAASSVIEARWAEASKGFDFLQRDAVVRALVDSGYPDAVSLLRLTGQLQSEPDCRQDTRAPGAVRHTPPDQSYTTVTMPADTVGVGDSADQAYWDSAFGYDPTSESVSEHTDPIRPSASKRVAGGDIHPGDRVRAVERVDGLKDDQKGVCLEVQGDAVWIKFDGEPIPRWLKNDLVTQETPKEQVLQEIDQEQNGGGAGGSGEGLAGLFG